MDFLSPIIEQARTFSWIDWTATVTAIIYVVLAARENSWCWFWGIISCSLWAYASFFFYQLWLDALLQLFYVVMAFVGLYQWKLSRPQESAGVEHLLDDIISFDNSTTTKNDIRPTTRMSAREHLLCWVLILPVSFLFGYFFANYTPAAATYADAFTTILSVVATLLLVQKKLETWLYWVLADSLYIWLYARQAAWLFALLMVIYTIISVFAYFRWQKQMEKSGADTGLEKL